MVLTPALLSSDKGPLVYQIENAAAVLFPWNSLLGHQIDICDVGTAWPIPRPQGRGWGWVERGVRAQLILDPIESDLGKRPEGARRTVEGPQREGMRGAPDGGPLQLAGRHSAGALQAVPSPVSPQPSLAIAGCMRAPHRQMTLKWLSYHAMPS